MADPEWKDPIVYSDQVKKQMEDDPKIAEMMREFSANMRQAHLAWKEGKYPSFEDAMEAISGKRPERVDEDDL